MVKKKKRKRTRRHQQKRSARAAKRRKAGRARRSRTSRPFSHHPPNLPDQQALVRGLMEMESLADEPEFADFELGEHAVEIVAETMASTDEEMDRLEEAGDEEAIDRLVAEAKSEALRKAVTPAVKADIRHRLERLSRRLHGQGQRQRADSFTALISMLDFPPFPWMLFEPLRRAFDDAVERTLSLVVLQQSIAAAAGRSVKEINPDEWSSLLSDPEIASRLEALYETDDILQEVIDSQFERVEDAFSKSLGTGQIDVALFSDVELALGIAWYEYKLDQAKDEWDDKDEESDESARLIVEASAEALTYLNTPTRRQLWQERLEQARAKKSWPPDIMTGLKVFSDMLAAPPQPDGPERFLLSTYLGELFREDDRLSTDSDEAQVQLARIQQIKERLKEGKSPLPIE